MGNKQSNLEEQVLNEYQRIDTADDSRFGQVTIAKSIMNGQLVWIKESSLVLEAKYELESYMQSIKKDKEYYRIFSTLNFFLSNIQNTLGYCTHEIWKSTVISQYFDKTLELEIDQRYLLAPKQLFPEDEIWLMFEALQEMELHYKAANRVNSDLRLSNIFIAEDGSIKFLDVFLVNWKLNSTMKCLLYGARVPLSPEKLAHLNKDKPDEEWSTSDEVWSLGMVLLCMATLKKDHIDFYNWTTKTVKRREIDLALEEVRMRYSHRLYHVINKCLLDNPFERMNINEFVSVPGAQSGLAGT